MPEVSVIVPVHGVEAFAGRCAESLMRQTLEDVEFIFVDDASPDRSMDIIRSVAGQYDRRVIFLRHETNKGLPAARNTGLAAASGKYVWHCDSDDWAEPDFLMEMYRAAEGSGADIAYCDFWLDYGDRRRRMDNPDFTSAKDMLERGLLAGQMKYNVWNKLILRSLYEGITFPEGHPMGEDMTIIAVASRAASAVHVAAPLYHYVKLNENAFSNSYSEKKLVDIRFNTERIQPFLKDVPVEYIAFFRLNVKLPFLFSGSMRQYRLWKEWFPSSNSFISRNRFQSARTRMVQQWASKGLWPLVWLYAFCVEKLYYGLWIRLGR